MYAIGGVSHHVCNEPGWRVLSRVHVIAQGLDILSRYPFEIQLHQYDHFVLLDSQPGQASNKQSEPVAEVSASSNVLSLLDLVPAGTEAHTTDAIKIIFVADDNDHSSRGSPS
jgi:hypothetical protein